MIGFVTGLVAEARLLRGFAVEVGGGTPAGAAAAARRLIDRGAGALVSFGLAGGLDPALRPGTIIVPTVIIGPSRYETDPKLSALLGHAPSCVGRKSAALISTRAVIATASEKRALFAETGASAVDLESGAVAGVAREAGLPFAILRAICDPAQTDLPPAALIALDGGGAISAVRLAMSVAVHPGQILSLLRLARDAARARAALVRRVDDLRVRGGLVGQLGHPVLHMAGKHVLGRPLL